MRLKDWRLKSGLTMVELGKRLGFEGSDPVIESKVRRAERGYHAIDVPLAEMIIEMTGGEVGLDDMHFTRREYLASQGVRIVRRHARPSVEAEVEAQ